MHTPVPTHDRAALLKWLRSDGTPAEVVELIQNTYLPEAARCVILAHASEEHLSALFSENAPIGGVSLRDAPLATAIARNPNLPQESANRLFRRAVDRENMALVEALRVGGHTPSKELLSELVSGQQDTDTRAFMVRAFHYDLDQEHMEKLSGPRVPESLLVSNPRIPIERALRICQKASGTSTLRCAARNPGIASHPVIAQLIVASLDRRTYEEYLTLASPRVRGQMFRMLLHGGGPSQALRLLENAPLGVRFDIDSEDLLPLQSHESAELRERAIVALARVDVRRSRETRERRSTSRPAR